MSIPDIVPFERNILQDILFFYTDSNIAFAAMAAQVEHKLIWGTQKKVLTTEDAYEQIARELHLGINCRVENKILKLNITLDHDKKK